jgi:hypothetical protein
MYVRTYVLRARCILSIAQATAARIHTYIPCTSPVCMYVCMYVCACMLSVWWIWNRARNERGRKGRAGVLSTRCMQVHLHLQMQYSVPPSSLQ